MSSAQIEKMEPDFSCRYTEIGQKAIYRSCKQRNSGSEGGQALEQVVYSVTQCCAVCTLGDSRK